MMKKNGELRGRDNVVHYVRPSKLVNGKVNGATFRPREGECGPSVNWLEYFVGAKDSQIDQARNAIPLTLSPNGVLAELNVGETTREVRDYVAPAIRANE